MCTTIPRSHGPEVQLKWHRLRRHANEAPMSRENLEAGLEAGAVMEADIHLTRDGHWVCLHDELLDEETTGTGPLAEHSADELRRLSMRTPAGAATGQAPLFLDDLVEYARRWSLSSAELQLDVKAPAEQIDNDVLDRFADQVGPYRASFSLSGADATALSQLRLAVPGLPVTLSSSGRLGGARDAAVFQSRMESLLNQLDGLDLIWVNHRVLQAAYRTRFDLVGFARQRGVAVDAGTIDIGAVGWRAALVLALQAKVDRITSNTPCAVAEQVERWVNGGGSQRVAAAS